MDIDRIIEVETDAAIDALVDGPFVVTDSDYPEANCDELERLQSLAAHLSDLAEEAKGIEGFENLTFYRNLGTDICLTFAAFQKLFGNHPDLVEKEVPQYNRVEYSVKFGDVEIRSEQRVQFKLVREHERVGSTV